MNDNNILKNDYQALSSCLDRQIGLESKTNEIIDKELDKRTIDECNPPQICHEFQTARLFLSHFGFLNLEYKQTDDSSIGGLLALDPTLPGFCSDLEGLDHISPRTCDTVHVFYVKSGQKSAEAILNNVVSMVLK